MVHDHAKMRFLEADNFPSSHVLRSRAHIVEPHFWVYGLLPSLPKEHLLLIGVEEESSAFMLAPSKKNEGQGEDIMRR